MLPNTPSKSEFLCGISEEVSFIYGIMKTINLLLCLITILVVMISVGTSVAEADPFPAKHARLSGRVLSNFKNIAQLTLPQGWGGGEGICLQGYEFYPETPQDTGARLWLWDVPVNLQIRVAVCDPAERKVLGIILRSIPHTLTAAERARLKSFTSYVSGYGDPFDYDQMKMTTRKLKDKIVLETFGTAYHHVRYVCSMTSKTGKPYHIYQKYLSKALYLTSPDQVVVIRYSAKAGDFRKYEALIDECINSIQFTKRSTREQNTSQITAVQMADTSCISTPPPSLTLNPFYKKYVDADNIPIVSSVKVPDAALLAARRLAIMMLSKRSDIRKALISNRVRIAVMSIDEVTTDIPEHSDLNIAFPSTDWNKRCRGIGATVVRPVSSVAEENLLRYPSDRYRGESIFIHEFAHTILTLGLDKNQDFRRCLQAAYDAACATGLWKNTYAASNIEEYWAEGVQDWFDANQHCHPPDGVHNEIHTQKQLKDYDPKLADLIAEVFPNNWKWSLVGSMVQERN